MPVLIEPLSQATVEAAAALEKECFSEPWSLDSLLSELSNPLAVFFVAKLENGDIIGYIGMHDVLGEGYITNIAVSKNYRRTGAGTALMQAIFDYARKNSLTLITLEVRPSNTPAIAMYEKFGFKTEGCRKAYYHAPTEDALLLTARLEQLI